jgi:hypothetical protein
MVYRSLNSSPNDTTDLKIPNEATNEPTPESFKDWPSYLGGSVLSLQLQFTCYFISLTFLSVGNWMLDLAHLIQVKFLQCFHNIRQKKYRRNLTFKDPVPFLFGPHASTVCTTYAIVLLFAITEPLVCIFAVPFFMFKYYVDKYNLTFVYTP